MRVADLHWKTTLVISQIKFLQMILHSREDDATLSVRCVPKSVYLDSRKVFYFDISFNFTPFHASCWTWNEKKYEQDLGRLLHRCLTQVVPRCSDGFIGNRIAKLILKKKNHRRQTDPISNLAEKMSTGRRALWSGRPMVHLLWGAASIWRCGKWKLEFSWIYSSQYISYRVARYEDDLWLW